MPPEATVDDREPAGVGVGPSGGFASAPARTEAPRMSGELLTVRGLDVRFDGFRAITDLDLTVNRGELRFLIGPNGAGKTTLVAVITGLTWPRCCSA